jgi:hypothetical protein
MIQDGYGLQNTDAEVFFSDADQAAIFVKASNGTSPLMANLASLAALRADGTNPSDEELKKQCTARKNSGVLKFRPTSDLSLVFDEGFQEYLKLGHNAGRQFVGGLFGQKVVSCAVHFQHGV